MHTASITYRRLGARLAGGAMISALALAAAQSHAQTIGGNAILVDVAGTPTPATSGDPIVGNLQGNVTGDYVTANQDVNVGNRLQVLGTTDLNGGTTNITGGLFTQQQTNAGNIGTATLSTTGLSTLNSAQVSTTLGVTGLSTLSGGVATPTVTGSGTNGSLLLQAGNASSSYIDVNNSGITLHGGTSSTTVAVDDNGFAVDLNDDGTPDFGALIDGSGNITGGIRGDWSVNGTLEVDGLATTNGITNTGVIRTDVLNVNLAIANSAVAGVPDPAPVVIADNLFVTGATTFASQVNANGGIVTNNANINAGTGTITAGVGNIATVNATTGNIGTVNSTTIVNSGNIGTDTLSTTGLATLNSASVTNDLSVGGNATITGTTTSTGLLTAQNGASVANGLTVTSGGATITGNTSVTGNLSATGSVTGNTVVATTSASVGTNLTVGGQTQTGTLAVTGAATVGGTLGVTGLTSTNGISNTGNIATGTGTITAGTVAINGTTNKISGLANATLSATSTEAVTGQQLFATNNRVTALEVGYDDLRRKSYQGTAMNFALNAAPLNLANGESGFAAGAGVYQGEWAGGVKAQIVTPQGIGFGANLGFSKDAVGGGVGASVKF